jgi:hypothetical protein
MIFNAFTLVLFRALLWRCCWAEFRKTTKPALEIVGALESWRPEFVKPCSNLSVFYDEEIAKSELNIRPAVMSREIVLCPESHSKGTHTVCGCCVAQTVDYGDTVNFWPHKNPVFVSRNICWCRSDRAVLISIGLDIVTWLPRETYMFFHNLHRCYHNRVFHKT